MHQQLFSSTDFQDRVSAVTALTEARCPTFLCWPTTKRPVTQHGLHDATLDREILLRGLRDKPTANLAMVTGSASRICVVDIDPGGEESLRRVLGQHGDFEPTFTVGTPRDGRHFYFLHPPGILKNTTGHLHGFDGSLPHIDFRGDNGYVIVPPSAMDVGGYSVIDPAPLAPLPDWMAALAQPQLLTQLPDDAGTSYGRKALGDEAMKVSSAEEGSRHNTLLKAACKCGSLIAGGELREDFVREQLIAAAQRNWSGNSESDLLAAINDGLKKGMVSPRSAPHATWKEAARRIEAAVQVDDWTGRRAQMAKEVLLGRLNIWFESGRRAPGVRYVADAIGVCKQTVANADALLQLRGWVERDKAERNSGFADKFTFRIPPRIERKLRHESHIDTHGSIRVQDLISHDVFSTARNDSGGLGRGVGRTWIQLLQGPSPTSIEALAERRGVTHPTIRKHLAVLSETGLAILCEGGWEGMNYSRAALDDLALECNSVGPTRRRRSHAKERRDWATARRTPGGAAPPNPAAPESSTSGGGDRPKDRTPDRN